MQAEYNKILALGIVSFVLCFGAGFVIRKDMYWVDFPLRERNPPLFSLKQMEKEALAACD